MKYKELDISDIITMVNRLIERNNAECFEYIELNPADAQARRDARDLMNGAYCEVLYHIGKMARGEE